MTRMLRVHKESPQSTFNATGAGGRHVAFTAGKCPPPPPGTENRHTALMKDPRDWTRKSTESPALRMASTACSWLASLRSTPHTLDRVPLCAAGLSGLMCLTKTPLIISPLLSLRPMPLPPMMLRPRDWPGARVSRTLQHKARYYGAVDPSHSVGEGGG
ncbi:hypothetical protein EYF80_028586 [Liparis tanakae]|uniref:Uncharacterized protein n=1 Tax=Liparis tanakae TaxID=230148 RepID=A0A4Z2H6B7_9TELE|nr:hypothetical protein EYF80_028586 [Liparis tanakae]